MISVNQEIGTSVPEKLNKEGGHMMFLIKGKIFECWGGEFKGGELTPWRTP